MLIPFYQVKRPTMPMPSHVKRQPGSIIANANFYASHVLRHSRGKRHGLSEVSKYKANIHSTVGQVVEIASRRKLLVTQVQTM